MTQSSFPFLFSSSFSCHRLVTLITILLLNPLPIIHGAPTKKSDNELTPNVQRHKRDVFTSDDDDSFNSLQANEYPLISDTKIIFEGLIGSYRHLNRKEEKTHLSVFFSRLIRLQIRFQSM